jgi:hypothetical protein
MKPARNSHHDFVVRIFMISALTRRSGVVPVWRAPSRAGLSSSVIGSPPFAR